MTKRGFSMIKRIGLFLCVNFVVLLTIGFLISLTGVDRWLTAEGIDYARLLGFSAVFGFAGSVISLLMSKSIAKMSMGARVISEPRNETEAWLTRTVAELARKAGVGIPEVAVYDGSANAFATGAFRDDALVAVSTGLLQSMTRPQIRAVLAHEMSHVKNGDMVTMTLVQGVLNTFVFFFARVVALFLDSNRNGDGRERSSGGFGYYFTVRIFEAVFGILASVLTCAFSRRREYRADAGAADLLGSPDDMIDALRALGKADVRGLPSEIKAFGIVDVPSFAELFATHPPLSARIKALSVGADRAVKRKPNRTGGLFGSVSNKENPWD